MTPYDVVIVGAGQSGLAAARAAQRPELDGLVLEASSARQHMLDRALHWWLDRSGLDKAPRSHGSYRRQRRRHDDEAPLTAIEQHRPPSRDRTWH